MKKNIFLITLILCVTNSFLTYVFGAEVELTKVLEIHVFLLVVFLLEETIYLHFLKKKRPQPMLFLSVNFFKIAFSIVFLFPKILIKDRASDNYIYVFLAAYFTLLFFTIFKKSKNKTNK